MKPWRNETVEAKNKIKLWTLYRNITSRRWYWINIKNWRSKINNDKIVEWIRPGIGKNNNRPINQWYVQNKYIRLITKPIY